MKENQFSHPKYNTSKKPKLDNGHGKWRGGEIYIYIYCTWEIYIALERGRERYGHDDRGRYGLTGDRAQYEIIGEDSSLVQCFNHTVLFSSLVQCFDHEVFVMELTR